MFQIKKLERPIEVTGLYTGWDHTYQAGFYFPGEFHNFWEILFVKKGSVTATGDGHIYLLKEGDIVFHKPMEFHTVKVEKAETRIQVLTFSATGSGMVGFEKKQLTLRDDEIALYGIVTKKFREAQVAYDSGNMDTFNTAGNYGAILLTELLLTLMKRTYDNHSRISFAEKRWINIINVLNEHIGEILSVSELASLCSMSESNLKKIFKNISDDGVAKFFLRMKLRKVMEMIDSGATLKEAAMSVGFTDINYFSTVFKRETGITASEYRKEKRAFPSLQSTT